MRTHPLTATLATLSACTMAACDAAPATTQAVYETDSRFEANDPQVPAYIRDQVASTFTLIQTQHLEDQGDHYTLAAGRFKTLKTKMNLCEGELFADQPAVTTCSGFLAAPNVAVTAGHCFRSIADCDRYSFIFGYSLDTKLVGERFPKSHVFSCPRNWRQRAVFTALEPIEGLRDYAVIRLDRSVGHAQPLRMRQEGRIESQIPLYMIGYPSGIPAKIALDGTTMRPATANAFSARLDAFHGNSGSAVFNAKTGEVEGILVRGADPDYTTSPEGCRRVRTISREEFDAPGNKETISSVESFRDLVTRAAGVTNGDN